ncbi:apolipoprotein N-acyltransferase [Candidatus Tisiphia endosymbiont of Beris chalybata]|uniref:apolipoprotein N-acyltransferase n=1 Tax=Candidatus Tisiphia endosymbiont of Beris chalybata TaxID=3066262 RepID=UPI00312C8255
MFTSKKLTSKKLIFAAGSLSGLAFAPIFFIPGLLAIALLCYQVEVANNWQEATIKGFIFGFGHFLTSMYWVSIGVSVYIEEFWWAIPFALFGLPIILAFFIASTCGFAFLAKKYNYYQFIFCVSWVFFEWLRSWLFTGLPWNLLGYALSFSDSLIQVTSLVGIYGLSFFTVYISSSFYAIFSKDYHKLKLLLDLLHNLKIIEEFLGETKSSTAAYIDVREEQRGVSTTKLPIRLGYARGLLLNSLIILLVIASYGVFRLYNNPTLFSDVKIRLVQPSIPQTAKWDFAEFWKNLDLHIKLSEKPGKVDLIIWSEAALVVPYIYEPVKLKILQLLKNKGAILITGGVTENGKIDNDLEIYTSLYALTPEGEQLFEYHKSHLVPFGEYMPLKKLLPLKKLTPGFLDYTAGDGRLVKIDSHNLTIKPLICYESIFPNFVRTSNEMADLIINVTNDAWYGKSSGPSQHLQISRMRSIENGLPMIRTANNGISAIIDPVGRIVQSLELNEISYIDNLIPIKLKFKTLYSQFGDICAFLAILLTFISYKLLLSRSLKKTAI